MAPIPKPPPDRWEKLAAAAARHGLPPRALRTSIESGLADIRCARLGKRQLLYVVAGDADVFARRLASTL